MQREKDILISEKKALATLTNKCFPNIAVNLDLEKDSETIKYSHVILPLVSFFRRLDPIKFMTHCNTSSLFITIKVDIVSLTNLP